MEPGQHQNHDIDPQYKEFIDNPKFENKVLLSKVMANESLKTLYVEKLCLLKTYFNTADLFAKIDGLKTLIENDLEQDNNFPFTISDFNDNVGFGNVMDPTLPQPVPGIKQFITDRVDALNSFHSSISFDCSNVSDIENINISELSIYPNPVEVSSTIYIDGENLVEKYFNLYDLRGQLVYSTTINDTQVQLPTNVHAGMYIYKIGTTTGKLVVK